MYTSGCLLIHLLMNIWVISRCVLYKLLWTFLYQSSCIYIFISLAFFTSGWNDVICMLNFLRTQQYVFQSGHSNLHFPQHWMRVLAVSQLHQNLKVWLQSLKLMKGTFIFSSKSRFEACVYIIIRREAIYTDSNTTFWKHLPNIGKIKIASFSE